MAAEGIEDLGRGAEVGRADMTRDLFGRESVYSVLRSIEAA
jgi:hypothetical protein